MNTRIFAVLACVALAACTSSEATVDGDVVTVKTDGSALFYDVATLTIVSQEKATAVCLAHGGAIASLLEKPAKCAAGEAVLGAAKVAKRSGFLDIFPANSVTKQWACCRVSP